MVNRSIECIKQTKIIIMKYNASCSSQEVIHLLTYQSKVVFKLKVCITSHLICQFVVTKIDQVQPEQD